MAEQHLTKSELAIMEVMWEQEEALTASEIIKASGDKDWKKDSLKLPDLKRQQRIMRVHLSQL